MWGVGSGVWGTVVSGQLSAISGSQWSVVRWSEVNDPWSVEYGVWSTVVRGQWSMEHGVWRSVVKGYRAQVAAWNPVKSFFRGPEPY